MLQPLPGQIWQLNTTLVSHLCHHPAPKYVMIVTESEIVENLQIVFVMLISEETNFLSEVDILIPSNISELDQDLLAHTWLVFPIFVHDLLYQVGARLSYQVYETLLNVGDYYHNLAELPTRASIHSLGLKQGTQTILNNDILKANHSTELNRISKLWAPVDNMCNNENNLIDMAEKVLNQAIQAATDLIDNTSDNIVDFTSSNLKKTITISRWLENLYDAEWQPPTPALKLVVPTRSANRHEYVASAFNEISVLIKQLSLIHDKSQQQSIAKRLGEIGKNNQSAIKALINLLQTTQDDETLWTAIESLWQIDPGNLAVGARRVKVIDLGIQLAGEGIALAIALIPKVNNRFGVLLQVYPTGREIYLPPQLKLSLLDTSCKVLRIVTAQLADAFIQLKFSGELGEPFNVKISLGEAEFIEKFII
jgi:Protein of unknown function (DUF1822)